MSFLLKKIRDFFYITKKRFDVHLARIRRGILRGGESVTLLANIRLFQQNVCQLPMHEYRHTHARYCIMMVIIMVIIRV
jgi:hypothetical protein